MRIRLKQLVGAAGAKCEKQEVLRTGVYCIGTIVCPPQWPGKRLAQEQVHVSSIGGRGTFQTGETLLRQYLSLKNSAKIIKDNKIYKNAETEEICLVLSVFLSGF
jgi:hypothetical protein